MGQDQVSGGVGVLCWLAAPVAMFYGNLHNLVIRSKSVIKSSSVISSQIGVMSDQLRVPLYMVMSQNDHVIFGIGRLQNFLWDSNIDHKTSWGTISTLEIVIQEVLWSIWGSYSAIWSIPLTNVKWHSDPWPTVTSQPIRLSTNFMTLIPSLTFTDYEWFPWSICNGCGMPAGTLTPSGHLVPSPILGLANAPIVETKFLELAMSLLDFSPRIPLGTFSILPSNVPWHIPVRGA